MTAVAGYNSRLQPYAIWGLLNNDYNQVLFGEQPNWGTTNNNGNVQSSTTYAGGPGPWQSLPQKTQSYSYDGVNRLTWAGDAGWTRSFGYDPYGNMWVTGNVGVPLAGNTPTSNIFNGSTNQMNGFGYDAAGNLQSVNGNTASYNAENQLVSVTEAPAFGGGTETLVYDGLGQRVQKLLSGGTTLYVYDAFGQLTAEYSTTTPPPPPCTTCYLSYDHLGSLRMVTDQNANVVARHDYLPFGEEILGGTAGRGSQWGAWDGVSQRFTGQTRDSETGMDYFNARYFTAPLGRFNSPDPGNAGARPGDPQTWNAYSYVRNDPLALVDPTGTHVVDCDWDDCSAMFHGGGGGGGGVIIDGVEQTIFNTSGLGGNALAACPNNFCSGFGTNLEGQTSYVQFTASAGSGPQGYRSIPEMGTYNYDIGNGQYLNAGQFNQAIQSAVNAQRVAFASAVTSKTGLDYNTVYNALQTQQNADGTTMVNGGNVQFGVNPLDPNYSLVNSTLADLVAAGQNNRTFGAPSIHLHGNRGLYHLDTASPYPLFGTGLFVHFGVDVFAGTLFYGPIPIPRP